VKKPHVDFGKVMERVRKIRSQLSHKDSAARLSQAGVDVFFGEARFVGFVLIRHLSFLLEKPFVFI